MVEGRALADNEFSFALYETGATFATEGVTPKETVKNVGQNITFSAINYTKVGTHYYVVEEKAGTASGITYDTTHYHIVVTVSASGASLVKSVSVNKIGHNDDNSGNVVFINSYQATGTEHTFQGVKVLHGRAPGVGEFDFALYQGDTLIDTAPNHSDGSFRFDPVPFTAPGSYTFTVKEIEPEENRKSAGVTYDGVSQPVTVTVKVEDENAVLKVTQVTVKDKNGTEMTDGILFENTYTPAAAQVTFGGTKELKGAALENNAFTFKLYETDHTFNISGKTGTVEVSFDVKVDAPEQVVTNTAVIRDGVNTYTTNEVVSHTVETPLKKDVFAAADTTVSIDGKQVKVGDELVYKISFTNASADIVDIKITDTIPANTTYVEGSADQGGVYGNGALTWQLENVAPWATVTVSFKVKVNAQAEKVENTANAEDGTNRYTTNTVANEVEKETPPPAQEENQPPNTGDETMVGLFTGLMLVSATMLAVLIVCKKKEEAKA